MGSWDIDVPNLYRRFLRAVIESIAETQNNNTDAIRARNLKFGWNHQAGRLSSPQQISCHKRVRIALSGAAGFNIIIWADLEALTAVQQHGNQMLFVCLTDSRRFICCAQFCYFQWISGLQSIRFPLQFLFSISCLWVLFTNQFERDELWGKSWQCSLFLTTRPFVRRAAVVEMFSYHILETNMRCMPQFCSYRNRGLIFILKSQ